MERIQHHNSDLQFDRAKFDMHTRSCEQARPEILAAFVSETTALVAELDSALRNNMLKQVKALFHKLKSSVALLCTDALLLEIGEVERLAADRANSDYVSVGHSVVGKMRVLVADVQRVLLLDCQLPDPLGN